MTNLVIATKASKLDGFIKDRGEEGKEKERWETDGGFEWRRCVETESHVGELGDGKNHEIIKGYASTLLLVQALFEDIWPVVNEK